MGNVTTTDTSVTATFDPSVISPQAAVLPAAVPGRSAGVMTAEQAAELATLNMGGISVFSNDGVGAPMRPAASAVGAVAGVTAIMIWNVSDKAPQFSDGVNWYDASGNIT